MNATVMMAMMCLLIMEMKITSNVLQFVIPILRPQALLIIVNVMVTQICNLMKMQTNFIALLKHVMKRLQHTTQLLMIAIVKLAMER